MRILDPDSINLGLEDLGLREDNLRIVKSAIERPNGLILNTGPTGSGKTTTLYTFLRYLNSPEVKIITVEDPIEYHLKGVQQTQVDPDVGYTFASGLRSILRQDPDVILVGEIRDLETGEIAIQAALTGHLVLSTLHTNDAVGTILRLTDLKIRPVSIAPALSLAIAQRLVRRLCEKCKVPQEVSPERKEAIAAFLDQLPSRVNRAPYQQYTIYGPSEKGCEACGGLGYKGRAAVFEFLENTPEIQEATLRGDSKARLTEIARKGGMVMMQEDGILKVLEGITTFEEVEDATGAIQWEAFLQKKNRLESGGNG
ncbi:type II/IV secretion system protein [Candidatus Parcubacteria bacterium]|nr:MAG: type II/IV secretion system protein [Candidatus Parcubacteria bacterium]